jgi:uncharacterized membrane protein YdjX (TVP38/TMEM64 family)
VEISRPRFLLDREIPMRRYWTFLALTALLFLALFGLASLVEIDLLEDPKPFLDAAGLFGGALIGIGLLVADVLLPIPASLVMIAHGSLFGVLLGTLVSLAGGVLASAFGFFLGRRSGPWLHRHVAPEESQAADALLARWGDLAIVATRPIPILAETMALFAGTTSIGWRRFLLASLLGNLPPALLYAATGAAAARLDDAFLVFGAVLLVAGLTWWLGQRLRASLDRPREGPAASG